MFTAAVTVATLPITRIFYKFSTCIKNPGTSIDQTFVFLGAKWCLKVYPGGINDEYKDSISLELTRECTSPHIHILNKLACVNIYGTTLYSAGPTRMFDKALCYLRVPRFINRFEGDSMVPCPHAAKALQDDILRIELMATKVPIAHHNPKFLEQAALRDVHRLIQTGKHSDVKLEIEGKFINAHKCILSARCVYFEAMFSYDMAESKTGVVKIADVTFDVFYHILRFIYAAGFDVPENELIDVWIAAGHFQLPDLKQLCADAITFNLKAENVCSVLVLSDVHQVTHMKQEALQFIWNNLSKVYETPEFKTLSPALHLEVLGEFAGGKKKRKQEEPVIPPVKKPRSLDEE